jgi:hypothetical protein
MRLRRKEGMSEVKRKIATWKFRRLDSGHEWECVLVAYWEVSLDPISDDYTPQEIDARELFHKWGARVRKNYPNGLIPIYWFVDCKGKEYSTLEGMPFQFEHIAGSFPEDFLSFFTWPVNSETGEPLNWLTLPVADKLWNYKRADKGGFIQQDTGWKPSILQPYVYLPALSSALRSQ